jgi:hypothetical protein
MIRKAILEPSSELYAALLEIGLFEEWLYYEQAMPKSGEYFAAITK